MMKRKTLVSFFSPSSSIMCWAAAAAFISRRRCCVRQRIDQFQTFSTLTLEERRVPMLMVFSRDQNPQSCRLLSLRRSKDRTFLKFEREIGLPEAAAADKNLCIGSSEGILFTGPDTENPKISAIDPLTGTHLPLPSTATLEPLVNAALYLDMAKAVISPSRDLVVLDRFIDLNFARIGGSRWTTLPKKFAFSSDIIFHKGLLYGLDRVGVVSIYDLNKPTDRPSLIGNDRLQFEYDGRCRNCLVESPDGKDLFLLYRKLWKWGDCTKYFKVFKLDQSRGKWMKVRSIGDVAIFVGISQSVSLQASRFPDILKPNSIYFTETHEVAKRVFQNKTIWDTGVYSLDDESLQFIDFDWPEWGPPPVWF